MSAPMPDFAMPPEASERRRHRLLARLGGRRAIGVGVAVAVVVALAIVGVPALVAQQRGADAVAVAERYAHDVAGGDLEAVAAALEPDLASASDALLRADLEPSAPFVVDDVRLVAVEGERAVVRVEHAIGAEDGSAQVVLVERDGAWQVVEGLMGLVRMTDELALALGVERGEADVAWSLPGRFGVEMREVGAVAVPPTSFSVEPGRTTDVALALAPSMATTGLAVDAVRERLAACNAATAPGCPGVPVEVDVQAPIMTWDLDLASRSGTVDVSLTLRVLVESGRSQAFVVVEVPLDVALSDDLATAVVAPASASAVQP